MYLLLLLLLTLRITSSEVIIEDELGYGMNITVSDCSPRNTDFLIWDAPLAYFSNHRKSKSPNCFDWSSDSCTSSPNHLFGFNFEPCCKRHDFAYRNLEHQHRLTSDTREEADENFLEDLKMVCMKAPKSSQGLCAITRAIYFSAVRLFGNPNKAMYAFIVGMIVYWLLVGLVAYWMVRRHRKRVRKVLYYGSDHSSMTSTFTSIHSRDS